MSPQLKRAAGAVMVLASLGALWLALTEQQGVAIVFACVAITIALFGRMLQSSAQHDELIDALRSAETRADDRAGVAPRLSPLAKD